MSLQLRLTQSIFWATAFAVAAAVSIAVLSPSEGRTQRSSGQQATAAVAPNQSSASRTWASHAISLVVRRVPSAGTKFTWTAKRADHVWCAIDGGIAQKCSSPKSYPRLSPGRHTFVVSGWNAKAKKSVKVSWTQATSASTRVVRAPVLVTLSRAKTSSPTSLKLVLSGLPAATTVATTQTFAWTGGGADGTWCSLDDGQAGPCSSPVTYTGLSVGPHSFSVSSWNRGVKRSAKAYWTIVPGGSAAGSPAPSPAPAPAPAPAPVTAPSTPPPTASFAGGTVREALPGQMTSVIAASAPGDTVYCRGGKHPKLTLSKSFSAPGIAVKCESGSYFEGIDTAGQSGYTFDGIESRVPVSVSDVNVTPFYFHGTSKRILLVGAFKLSGGYDAIKVYGGCTDCVIDDGGAASDVTGFGGDGIHLNQFTNFRIVSVRIRDPYNGVTPEHNDGIQAQAGSGLYLGPGVRLSATNGPRSDVDSAGVFINSTGGLSNVEIDNVKIQSWQIGRGIQVLGVDGTTVIRNLVVTDCGIPGSSPPITLGANNSGQRFELYGVDPKNVYFNNALAKAQTLFK